MKNSKIVCDLYDCRSHSIAYGFVNIDFHVHFPSTRHTPNRRVNMLSYSRVPWASNNPMNPTNRAWEKPVDVQAHPPISDLMACDAFSICNHLTFARGVLRLDTHGYWSILAAKIITCHFWHTIGYNNTMKIRILTTPLKASSSSRVTFSVPPCVSVNANDPFKR